VHAATYVGAKTLTVIEKEPELPGRGQVQIDVAYTGICGTDLHIFHGDMDARVTLPAVLGHEMSGTIVAVGEGVNDWSPGDLVTVIPLVWDGTCPACRAGYNHICHNLDFLGIDSPGSMQASWTVPQEVLVALPPSLSLEHAALADGSRRARRAPRLAARGREGARRWRRTDRSADRLRGPSGWRRRARA
jgi:(R,R)-butanediol dehydrogenase / meso-butanediol dehydrogenase / diacetyl reductase